MTRRPTRSRWLGPLLFVLAFVAGPTAGDIGSCGQDPEELDPVKFFNFKESVDCRACQECAIATEACTRACDAVLDQSAFPDNCVPLVHDGEVCLNALAAADCEDYAGFMSDTSPTVPTECNFCPVEAP